MNRKKEVTKSIFGKDIDQRCPGWGFFSKMLVFLGLMSDAKQSELFADIDEQLEKREARRCP